MFFTVVGGAWTRHYNAHHPRRIIHDPEPPPPGDEENYTRAVRIEREECEREQAREREYARSAALRAKHHP